MNLCFKLSIFALLHFSFLPAFADWPNWRGPNFDGSVNDEESYPVSFNQQKGVKWVHELSGPSASTPIVFNERVFCQRLDWQMAKVQNRPCLPFV